MLKPLNTGIKVERFKPERTYIQTNGRTLPHVLSSCEYKSYNCFWVVMHMLLTLLIFTSRVSGSGHKNGPVRLCVCVYPSVSAFMAELFGHIWSRNSVQGLTLIISWTSLMVKVKGQGHQVKNMMSMVFWFERTYIKNLAYGVTSWCHVTSWRHPTSWCDIVMSWDDNSQQATGGAGIL